MTIPSGVDRRLAWVATLPFVLMWAVSLWELPIGYGVALALLVLPLGGAAFYLTRSGARLGLWLMQERDLSTGTAYVLVVVWAFCTAAGLEAAVTLGLELGSGVVSAIAGLLLGIAGLVFIHCFGVALIVMVAVGVRCARRWLVSRFAWIARVGDAAAAARHGFSMRVARTGQALLPAKVAVHSGWAAAQGHPLRAWAICVVVLSLLVLVGRQARSPMPAPQPTMVLARPTSQVPPRSPAGCTCAVMQPRVPGNPATANRVVRLISEQLGVPISDVQPDRMLVDLGSDSLDYVEMVMALEDEFALEIPDQDAEVLCAVHEVVAYIERRLVGLAAPGDRTHRVR